MHLESLQPLLDCVASDPSGDRYAVFGYLNGSAEPVSVPLGTNNAFIPGPTGRGQPSIFEPGPPHHGAFAVKLGAASTTWYLGEEHVTVGSIAPSCGVVTLTDGEYASLPPSAGGGRVLLKDDSGSEFAGTIVPTDGSFDPQGQTGVGTGTLSGDFGVNAEGAATYTIPLVVPPGRAGIQPDLSLRYNSQRANGLVGVGWSLSGIPKITRCAKTLASDNVAAPVTFTSSDRLCLDGDYLIEIPQAPPIEQSTGRQFAPEHDPFARVVIDSAPEPEDSLGPRSFTLYLRNGQKLRFGTTPNSVLEGNRVSFSASLTDGSPVVPDYSDVVRLAWSLSEIADRSGNRLTVDYSLSEEISPSGERLGYEQLATSINYTYGVTHTTPLRRVDFKYIVRPDVEDRFVSGFHIRAASLLNEVDAFAPNPTEIQRVLSYRLVYSNDSITGRSLLRAVAQCDAFDICLRPTTFDWELGTKGYGEQALPLDPPHDHYWPIFAGLASGDVNGDGRDDIVYLNFLEDFEQGENGHVLPVAVYGVNFRLSMGTTFGPEMLANVEPYGFLHAFDEDFPPVNTPPTPRLVDIDMDGRDELVVFSGGNVLEGVTPPYQWRIYKFNGTNFVPYESATNEAVGILNPIPTIDTIGYPHPIPPLYIGDMDGDAQPEFMRSLRVGDVDADWAYRLNIGGDLQPYQNFLPGTAHTFVASDDFNAYVAGFDGSGRAALLVRALNPTGFDARYTALMMDSGGTPFEAPTTLPAGDKAILGFHYFFLDYNGDGLTDALQIPNVGGPPKLAINSGNGFFAPRTVSIPAGSPIDDVAFLGSGPLVPTSGDVIGDDNEDGHPDVYLTGWLADPPGDRTQVALLEVAQRRLRFRRRCCGVDDIRPNAGECEGA